MMLSIFVIRMLRKMKFSHNLEDKVSRENRKKIILLLVSLIVLIIVVLFSLLLYKSQPSTSVEIGLPDDSNKILTKIIENLSFGKKLKI